MTRQKTPTLTGLPSPERFHDERDKKYTKCRDIAISFLAKEDIKACRIDNKEADKRFPKMLSDMAIGIFFNDNIRKKVYPESIQTPQEAVAFVLNGVRDPKSKSHYLFNFLMLSLTSYIDNTYDPEELKRNIGDRVKPYLKNKFKEWTNLVKFTPATDEDKLSSEDEEIRLRLIQQGYNFPQLIHEFFNDLTQTELMNHFGFFLRDIGIKQVRPSVMSILGILLSATFKKKCDELLDQISDKRAERKHIDRQRSGTLLQVKAIQKPDYNEFDDQEDDPLEPKVSEEAKLDQEILLENTGNLLTVEPVEEPDVAELQPLPAVSDLEEVQHDAHYQDYLNNLEEEIEGFAKNDFEDTGKVNRDYDVSIRTKRIINILLGTAAASVFIAALILLYTNIQKIIAKQQKGKDTIASTLETTNSPKNHIKIPKQVIQADASIAPPMRPTPPPGPKRVTPVPAPDPIQPKPIDTLKKSNPNLTKIAQMSANDLPANYTDKYKSLFLGQKINLNGDSMSKYIEDAINEIGTRKQRRKLRKYLEHKMRPGWAMYMASINDPWFDNEYAKTHKRWHKKGNRDFAKYLKLKSKKKLSKWEKAKLEKYEEQMRVGKLTMASLIAVNPGKDPNNLNSANFSNENGEVATIVIEMAQTAGLEVPEIITAEILETPNPKQPEVQLADITPIDNSSQENGPNVNNNDHDPVQAGQDLLKRVQQTEAQQAVKAEVAGQTMVSAADKVLDRMRERREARRAAKSQIMEDAADRVLDRLEIGRKIREMAEVRNVKTDNDYYASIEIKEEDPFESAVMGLDNGTYDEDAYVEIETKYEDEDYAEVEIVKADPIDNYYSLIEIEEPKPKGVLSKMRGWFNRKAA